MEFIFSYVDFNIKPLEPTKQKAAVYKIQYYYSFNKSE